MAKKVAKESVNCIVDFNKEVVRKGEEMAWRMCRLLTWGGSGGGM